MRIVLIGAPGSGKTWLAQKLSVELGMPHLEADTLFWREKQDVSLDEFRARVRVAIEAPSWIFEGHIGKLGDLVLPEADKIILLDTHHILSLVRSFIRDFKNQRWEKIFFNFHHHEKLKEKREAVIREIKRNRPHDLLIWQPGRPIPIIQ